MDHHALLKIINIMAKSSAVAKIIQNPQILAEAYILAKMLQLPWKRHVPWQS